MTTEPTNQGVVLDVRNLTVVYDTEKGPLPTVRNVSLQIAPGEIYGLVGESGSGKSTLAGAIVRYLPPNGRVTSGTVALDGVNLLELAPAEVRRVWGAKITMVHQDPTTAVNPAIVVGEQIAEIARRHMGLSRKEAWDKAIGMLDKVRMPDPETVARRYPHQLSGGQLQRVLIATALTTNPRLLIMDEPTTALDVTTEAVILDLVRDLLREYNTGVLYITHNLGVVARLCHRVAVLYAGEIMEQGTLREVFKRMLHPYTLALLGSVPRVEARKADIALSTIPGYIPRPGDLPAGCIFAPRCPMAEAACRATRPPLVEAEPDHLTACRRWPEARAHPDRFAPPPKIRDYERRAEGPVVLDARQIKKYFPAARLGLAALWQLRRPVVHAVEDMSVRVRGRFTMGLVGESGCGKTTFARCIAGLETATGGEIELEGQRVPNGLARRPAALLKKIQMVFQNPDASLNPHYTVGQSVARPLQRWGRLSKTAVDQQVRDLFGAVNLPEEYLRRLPSELSGGEKQRVAIARAFASDPTLMICDEPISSLDVSVQAALMNLLVELQETKGTSYLFISHDLAAVRHLSDWIAVVYLGRIVEIGSAHDVFAPPYHPYTEALLSAIPVPDPDAQTEGIRLGGTVPSAVNPPTGCPFHTRCPRKIGAICEREAPPVREGPNYHQIVCHIPLEELQALQTPGPGRSA